MGSNGSCYYRQMSTPSTKKSALDRPSFLAVSTLVAFIALAGVFSIHARGAAPMAAPRVPSITQITHDGFRKTHLIADESQLYVTEVPAAHRVIAKVSLPESNRS